MIESATANARRSPTLFLGRLVGDVVLQTTAIVVVILALAALGALLYDVFSDGWGRLNWQFLTSLPSRRPADAGIYPALIGTLYLITLTTILALPDRHRGGDLSRGVRQQATGWRGSSRSTSPTSPACLQSFTGCSASASSYATLGFGRSVMAGAATMALLVLPIVILSTREALRTVPKSLREGSYALGATKWQTIWHQVLPSAMPSLFTGVILALSRAIGETAPLITIGALTYVPFAPDSIWSPFTVLPIQIFDWLSRPQVAFSQNAAAGIIVLLALLLTMNGVAIFLRDRYQQRRS